MFSKLLFIVEEPTKAVLYIMFGRLVIIPASVQKLKNSFSLCPLLPAPLRS
jgi:hypothetical protein